LFVHGPTCVLTPILHLSMMEDSDDTDPMDAVASAYNLITCNRDIEERRWAVPE